MLNSISMVMWILLISTSILIIVASIDNVILDVYYWYRTLKKKLSAKFVKPINYDVLDREKEQPIALMIPCWQEADVIIDMLKYNLSAIDYKNYQVFVGVYPNDRDSIEALKTLSETINFLHIAIANHPGPTNKADNLNSIVKHILHYEKKHTMRFKMLLMHDAEDLIHPISLKLCNHLSDRVDMIQFPVIPIRLAHSEWTHWTYADEFSEMHLKEMLTREELGGFVPSAGVGTAFSRKAIATLVSENNGKPFMTDSLTEDYDCALRINLSNLKAIFLVQFVKRLVTRKVAFFNKVITYRKNELVATRSLFPCSYTLSVRQRSRWSFGIIFQEWHKIGWQGNFITKLLLYRDRKPAFSTFIIALSYILLFYWIIIHIISHIYPNVINLDDFLTQSPWVFTLIIICTILMIHRLLERAIVVTRVYGLAAGLLSIPRVVYANLINIQTILRTYRKYVLHIKTPKKVAWVKTKNRFPSGSILDNHRRRLGDIMLEYRFINREKLLAALDLQESSPDKIGKILLDMEFISKPQLIAALAHHHDLPKVDSSAIKALAADELKELSPAAYQDLIKNAAIPFKKSGNVVYIALKKSMTSDLITKILDYFKSYRVEFVVAR